jgi:hypothetical protein
MDTQWRALNIGYFDPDLPEIKEKGDYVIVGNNIY